MVVAAHGSGLQEQCVSGLASNVVERPPLRKICFRERSTLVECSPCSRSRESDEAESLQKTAASDIDMCIAQPIHGKV